MTEMEGEDGESKYHSSDHISTPPGHSLVGWLPHKYSYRVTILGSIKKHLQSRIVLYNVHLRFIKEESMPSRNCYLPGNKTM